MNDLHEHGENSIYGLAGNLNANPITMHRHMQSLVESGRVMTLTSDEFQGDGSNRIIYFLPEQLEQAEAMRKRTRAYAITRECEQDYLLRDYVIQQLMKLPAFDATVNMLRAGGELP